MFCSHMHNVWKCDLSEGQNKPWHQLSNLQQSSAILCFTHDYSLMLDKCYTTLLMPKSIQK